MRYVVGIDLGTTNSSVCFVDTQDPKRALQLFRVPQVHSLGHVEALPTLPSFCYCEGAHALPWNKRLEYVVGVFAREEGAKTPTKLVESAKSWLCHAAADRGGRLLPIEAAREEDRISPVEASARYLRHIKEAWDYTKAKGADDALFVEQDIVLTVPASFDEAARALTVEAAKLAGIKQLTLLEEPQAAFYSWIAQHEDRWKESLAEGDSVLVCDVGGGTTDFSLIEVHGQNGDLSLQRMAVGNHLLLGGDNMDRALAYIIEERLFKGERQELPLAQWHQLRHQARKAKEILLGEETGQEKYRFLLQGGGSSVVAQTLSAEISREELRQVLTEGFFPTHTLDEALKLRRSAGVKTAGLPYEVEPAITKHLAHFLYSASDFPTAPRHILFNGGTMKPRMFQEAIQGSVAGWFSGARPNILPSYHLDLAVARGAAYYGCVRRGYGVRIGGGSARGYYLGVDLRDAAGIKTTKALALLPRGSEEGDSYEPEQVFSLVPNTPVSFALYSSHVRLNDRPGTFLTIDSKEMQALPPIKTVLRFGKGDGPDKTVPVRMGIALTAVGTLELWLKSEKTSHRWELEFQLRNAEGKELTEGEARQDETFDKAYFDRAGEAITCAFFGKEKLGRLMERLEELLERPRREWPPSLLRRLWEQVNQLVGQRKRSQEAEARWWNLSGFLLRPGFGYPLDDFRIKELWKVLLADGKAARPADVEIQRLICLRRIAGGLNRGQQGQVAAELWTQLLDKRTGKIAFTGKGDTYEYTERIRAAASLELVDPAQKIKLGRALLERVGKRESMPVEYWALGRLGARHLFHGSAAHIIPRDIAADWVSKLLDMENKSDEWAFAIGQIARKTGQRELDLPKEVIERALEDGEKERFKRLLTEALPLTQNEQNAVFGEQLPAGLVLDL